ncbi:hypothetical protein [Parasitella parasitica]|uniref:Nudix hydrolase domain-containing protein n=1 Tax=Parasitella parasitica TaxID=35722 RepID=A0A0B7MUX3_9FUNG|nr:hypothetical protein [Parasitella parasitica]
MSKQDLRFIFNKFANNEVPSTTAMPINVRKACVAAIIRWRPYSDMDKNSSAAAQTESVASPMEFLNQPWVNDTQGEAELLFIQRALHPGDFWSGHVAFPGGKNEAVDQSNIDTVVRECKEEIGIDLSSPDFIPLGTLEHREIKNIKKNKLMMVLIPHVFLQVSPITPPMTIQASEVADIHWIPVKYLLKEPIMAYNPMGDVVVAPEMHLPWPESVRVPAIPFTITKKAKKPYLWGMTLRMTQEILGMTLSRTLMSDEDAGKYESKL